MDQSSDQSSAAALINNDSCARTPKIVGKLGNLNLDSTQLLLSANINHNHHEQQEEGSTEGGEVNSCSAVVKSVEWKGSCEEQRQEMVTREEGDDQGSSNSNNNNSVHAVNNEEPSLRRRKSGFCEPSVEMRHRLAEDSVSVVTGS